MGTDFLLFDQFFLALDLFEPVDAAIQEGEFIEQSERLRESTRPSEDARHEHRRFWVHFSLATETCKQLFRFEVVCLQVQLLSSHQRCIGTASESACGPDQSMR